jgi:hypothetical protein
MRITRATPDDLDALVAFRDQAAAWLATGALFQRPAQRVPTPHLQEVDGLTS